MPARMPIALGSVFERLTVIKEAPFRLNKKGERVFCVLTRCACGNEKVVTEGDLRRGHAKSCGCWNVDCRATHKLSKTKIHRCWAGMLNRCSNPNNKNYEAYGGRGILVCERWFKFENFLEDMGQPPPGTSLDRINNNGPYSPENCRWATVKQQASNRRKTQLVVISGRKMCASDAANILGMNRSNLQKSAKIYGSYQRAVDRAINRKWSEQ